MRQGSPEPPGSIKAARPTDRVSGPSFGETRPSAAAEPPAARVRAHAPCASCEHHSTEAEECDALRACPVLRQQCRAIRSLITGMKSRGADRPSKGGTLFLDPTNRLSIRNADEAFARETALSVQAQHQCSAAQQRGSPWLSDGARFDARARASGAQPDRPRSSGEEGRGRHAWSSAPPSTVGSSGDLAEGCDGSSHRASVAGDALHKCPGQHVIAAAGGRCNACREAALHPLKSTE